MIEKILNEEKGMKMSNPKFNVEKVFPRTEMFREASISNKSLILM